MTNKKSDDTYIIRDLYETPDKIYARQAKGTFAYFRIFSVLGLLGFYYLSPWLTWDSRQAILFDLPARQFHLFGITFWPQDFIYLTLLLVICAVALFLFTAIAGRLWCGYACPQTVWTQTFMWIEEWIEGNRNKRIKLDSKPWGFEKLYKKASKHTLWIIFALFTGYTFVGYFSPIRELGDGIINLSLGSWEWFWIGLYSLATYGNAGRLREQVCLHMCPYARFQSAMFDKDTLIISYDKERGESRGRRKKDSDYQLQGLGDCIDCNQCVHVCPTGIDIRDGLQYECIACAACIDVCDNVMEKMDYKKGLIQYTTENAEKGNPTELFRPRTILYIALFLGLILTFVFLIATRTPLDVNVIRDRNNLYTETFSGDIENTYQLKILNMSQITHDYQLTVQGISSITVIGDTKVTIEAGEVLTLPIRISVPFSKLKHRSTDIFFRIETIGKNEEVHITKGKFLGPNI
jgi:cytochrome c oxidase accessory protein FixG